MPILPADVGADDALARRILVRARAIAPCISTFEAESEERADAVAILTGVYARAAAIGTGVVASQGRNGTSISFREIKSAFSGEDEAGLRSLCGVDATLLPGLPRGSFPTARPVTGLWPEEYS
jgi:hypothetical protein